jgi:hypothetical protein
VEKHVLARSRVNESKTLVCQSLDCTFSHYSKSSKIISVPKTQNLRNYGPHPEKKYIEIRLAYNGKTQICRLFVDFCSKPPHAAVPYCYRSNSIENRRIFSIFAASSRFSVGLAGSMSSFWLLGEQPAQTAPNPPQVIPA